MHYITLRCIFTLALFDPIGTGIAAERDLNNLNYVPLDAAIFRLEDNCRSMRDEVDGIYLRLGASVDSIAAASLVGGILNASHRHAGDFSVIGPAELLAEQRRTERLFSVVMVAIASISLLVGGIGIMASCWPAPWSVPAKSACAARMGRAAVTSSASSCWKR